MRHRLTLFFRKLGGACLWFVNFKLARVGQKVTHIPGALRVTGPVVIHTERDESEHRDVEADMPARIGSLYGILRIMSKDTQHKKKRDVRGIPDPGVYPQTYTHDTAHSKRAQHR